MNKLFFEPFIELLYINNKCYYNSIYFNKLKEIVNNDEFIFSNWLMKNTVYSMPKITNSFNILRTTDNIEFCLDVMIYESIFYPEYDKLDRYYTNNYKEMLDIINANKFNDKNLNKNYKVDIYRYALEDDTIYVDIRTKYSSS